MDDFSSGRSKSWSVYTGANPSPSQAVDDRDTHWRDFGTSANAISFGLVATAILISLFLIMAIYEHLLRPRSSLNSPQDGTGRSLESGHMQSQMHILEKLGNSYTATTASTSDFSVLMPGQPYPTYIAHSAPLPCPKEGIRWPSHDHGISNQQWSEI